MTWGPDGIPSCLVEDCARVLVPILCVLFNLSFRSASFGGVHSLFIGCSLITSIETICYCFFIFVVNLKIFGKVTIDYGVSQQ
ncbi:unnamed protein product [Acanthoscelides obtectus]|uniref:Uncharacterized protein n=1 Tax=Acanthoscelides obtectus TaxID=200917 RepID=A0A9P0K7X2_ACAOB|nr:unnamed protein product [Acanthoscelides obtectus]CAK1639456.1 hypothetical protein AOBTE_LOCUS11187 [Acanthoscelides obtectus]